MDIALSTQRLVSRLIKEFLSWLTPIKVVQAVGILAAGVAVEGLYRFGVAVDVLYRFGQFVGVNSIGGGPPYRGMLFLVVIAAIVLLQGVLSKGDVVLKWTVFVTLFGSTVLMLFAPNAIITWQIIIGLAIATVASAFITTEKKIAAVEE